MKLTAGLCLLAGLILVGCGPSEHTVATGPDGSSVTKSDDGSKMTYQDGKGNSASVGSAVTEADLGLPFYPDSSEKPTATMSADENGIKTVMSGRTTKDDPEKVGEFYKTKIRDPKLQTTSISGTNMIVLSGKLDSGAEVMITAMRKDAQDTEISVAVKHPKK